MKPDPSPPAHRSARGFTLIEALVVVTLLALIAGLAAPSFAAALRRQRERNTAQELLAALQLARIQAQRTGQQVVLRRNEPCPASTEPGQWRCGWRAFVDLNRNEHWDSGEPVLQHSAPSRSTWVHQGGLPNLAAHVSVTRFGGLPIGMSLSVHSVGVEHGDGAPGMSLCVGGNRLRLSEKGACNEG